MKGGRRSLLFGEKGSINGVGRVNGFAFLCLGRSRMGLEASHRRGSDTAKRGGHRSGDGLAWAQGLGGWTLVSWRSEGMKELVSEGREVAGIRRSQKGRLHLGCVLPLPC